MDTRGSGFFLLLLVTWIPSCAPPPPLEYVHEEPGPSDHLYADHHILEIASQVQDITVRAVSEAVVRLDRGTPDYGPLEFTSSLGLRLTYKVTAEDRLDHHRITLSSTRPPLSDAAALNMLRFVADLLGVQVSEAHRDDDRRYVLPFDLNREGQTALLDNLQTAFDQDDILLIWKQSVLNQVSVKPIRLESLYDQ
ncbi:MAG: hypothetical protein KAW17_07610 [Candidatus Eisenbacteria sp.]|nr:hypothetical protein [Candidatus Eisenbacteria bacterium]